MVSNMDIKFESINDLYNRVLPALKTKKREFQRKGIIILEKELFSYLVNTKWSKTNDLSLNEIVNDILSYDGSN